MAAGWRCWGAPPVAWLLDPATGAVLHEISLGDAAPDRRPPGPRSTHPVWAPDSASFYAQDNVHGVLVRVDVAPGDPVLSVRRLPARPALRGPVVGARLALLCRRIWPTSRRYRARLYALCVGAADGAVPPSVVVFDAATGRMLADVPIPLAEGETGELHHGALDGGRGRFFVANLGQGRPRGGHSVHVLDTERLRLMGRLEAGAGAGHPVAI